MAAYAIPILAASVPVGHLADRLGRRPILLRGLLLTGAGSVLIAASTALAPLLLGRAVQGVGATLSWVTALALVSDLARPGRKGEALGFAFAANSLGAVGGPALGGIIGGTVSFETPFFLVAGIALAIFAAGLVILPRAAEPVAAADDERPNTIRLLLRPAALVPAIASATGAIVFGLIDFVVPLDFDRRLGTTATTVGVIFAAIALIDGPPRRLPARRAIASGAGRLRSPERW